mgnify:CR=1 FL=1
MNRFVFRYSVLKVCFVMVTVVISNRSTGNSCFLRSRFTFMLHSPTLNSRLKWMTIVLWFLIIHMCCNAGREVHCHGENLVAKVAVLLHCCGLDWLIGLVRIVLGFSFTDMTGGELFGQGQDKKGHFAIGPDPDPRTCLPPNRSNQYQNKSDKTSTKNVPTNNQKLIVAQQPNHGNGHHGGPK